MTCVVLVSGANRGIGYAIAGELNKRGWSVSAGVRDPNRADALKEMLDPSRSLIAPYEARVAASPTKWVETTLDKFGRIDALVVNAGIAMSCGIESGKDADLDLMWEVNAKAPWQLVRAALDPLKKSGAGRVVLVSSIAGKRVRTDSYTGYSMSKFALMALGQGLRLYGFEHGIRVCSLMPGIVATDMTMAHKGDGSGVPTEDVTEPKTMAQIAAMVLELPNNTYFPELGVANRLETGWA
jgi:NAD(P)-dependent dehydrogenase (short-subunit alcohol dehydrogenase family)